MKIKNIIPKFLKKFLRIVFFNSLLKLRLAIVNLLFINNKNQFLKNSIENANKFIYSQNDSRSKYIFKYSSSSYKPTLYSSAYACMALKLIGKLPQESSFLYDWKTFFDKYQSSRNGLFYDRVIESPNFVNSDWWGLRHLALHMVCAYNDLGEKPRYPFYFLSDYYDGSFLEELSSFDWNSYGLTESDIDNKIMNIGCLLQYQRDTWNDEDASKTLNNIRDFLISRINPKTNLWGIINEENRKDLSRVIQFAYHVIPLFLYDNILDFDFDRIVSLTLLTQNSLGGYGVQLNSSACEDIDSIDLLIRMYPLCSDKNRILIEKSITKFLPWLLSNQVKDGGFVFRLYEDFWYGSDYMASNVNQGAMFPTWFRLLSLAKTINFLGQSNLIKIDNKSPGLKY